MNVAGWKDGNRNTKLISGKLTSFSPFSSWNGNWKQIFVFVSIQETTTLAQQSEAGLIEVFFFVHLRKFFLIFEKLKQKILEKIENIKKIFELFKLKNFREFSYKIAYFTNNKKNYLKTQKQVS